MLPIKPEWNEAWLRTGFMSAMSTIVIEDETKLGTVIGIDLGTTHSCVGVYKDGHVEIVPNDHGNRITPSWVAFTDSQRLIGEAAKNQAAANAKRTIFDVKRLIGRNFQDKEFQRVYEGESSLPKDCTLLGTLQFSGITSGTHQFEVTFEVDASGILIVTAEGKASGKSEKMIFKGRLSQEEIERMVKEEEFYASVEKKLKEKIDARNTLEKYIYARKSEMKNRNELAGKLERDDKKKMEAALKDALEWLNDNHSAEEEEFHEKLKELRAVCSPIITEAFTKYGLGPVGDLQSTEDDEARL